jgi:hypothetical protein
MILDHGTDAGAQKHLFAKFLGGGVGFYYDDLEGNRVYCTHENAVGLLQQSLNHNWMFRTSVSQEHANGVTKRFRENEGFRILVPSYCSHDFYHGRGECNEIDGFCRYGYLAATAAVEYALDHFNTDKIITYGGSAGAAGFYIGVNQEKVVGMIMDSQAIDVSAISDACYDGFNVFGNSDLKPCFCPVKEGNPGPTCMEILVERIGFTMGEDEPYHYVERGDVDKPIYMVWNQFDASRYAYLQYENLQTAIEQYNPGGYSVARMVCIDDPNANPGPTCSLHVPSAYDYPDTLTLVQDIYRWGLFLVGDLEAHRVYLPGVME